MANIKSAIKRAGTNEKARLRNKAVRTHLKTSVKKFDAALSHPTQNSTNKQENEWHGQKVPCYAEERGLPPRHTESPAERNRPATLNDGKH